MGLSVRTAESLERLLGPRVRFPVPPARTGSKGTEPKRPPVSAVVRPTRAADVVQLVRWARTHRVGLVARGGGTSLVGGSDPHPDEVVVDFSSWTRPARVDPMGRRATVGPGTITAEVSRLARRYRLFFPPNPGSWRQSTIGGNAATNAGGPRSFRYGTTRAWVAGARAVLGTGVPVALGTEARKRSAGPELLDLLVGSEGTLGLFTELTVRLAPLPASRSVVVAPLPARSDLGEIVRRLTELRGARISAVEYLDAACSPYLARRLDLEGADDGLLLVEVEGEERTPPTGKVIAVLRRTGSRARHVTDLASDALWDLRGEAGVALDREIGPRIREDVAVPIRSLNGLRRTIEALARRFGVRVATFGHVGDGNLHPNFVVDPNGPTAARLQRELWSAVRSLGGTISGEHGIGRIKRSALGAELGGASVAWLRAVKEFCDPDGILNPGTLFP